MTPYRPSGNIRDEFVSKDTNARGTLSMANTGLKHSGGSQFFLNGQWKNMCCVFYTPAQWMVMARCLQRAVGENKKKCATSPFSERQHRARLVLSEAMHSAHSTVTRRSC